MKEKLTIAAMAVLLGVGLYYSVHNAKQSADDPAVSSSIANVAPVVKSICVTPTQNLTRKNLAMDGLDGEFVAQLTKVGFVSQKGAGTCDATAHAEVVDITGRGRKTARVDFRLTLANERVPRISSSVEGKSGGSVSEFKINPDSKESAGAEREAIVAALGKTAAQIDAANRKGLRPWSAKER
jgi:hypothetical protein